jgi:hypothetical protein
LCFDGPYFLQLLRNIHTKEKFLTNIYNVYYTHWKSKGERETSPHTCLVQRLKAACIPANGLNHLWARSPFRGNPNYWQVSQEANSLNYKSEGKRVVKEMPTSSEITSFSRRCFSSMSEKPDYSNGTKKMCI